MFDNYFYVGLIKFWKLFLENAAVSRMANLACKPLRRKFRSPVDAQISLQKHKLTFIYEYELIIQHLITLLNYILIWNECSLVDILIVSMNVCGKVHIISDMRKFGYSSVALEFLLRRCHFMLLEFNRKLIQTNFYKYIFLF